MVPVNNLAKGVLVGQNREILMRIGTIAQENPVIQDKNISLRSLTASKNILAALSL
jgi:hypothetical protein